MLFNSMEFLIFFPVVCLVYFIFPHRFRWLWLLVASYYFYMCWNPTYALLMGASTIITYISGLLISYSNRDKNETRKRFKKKMWVALSFMSNLSILFFFKYFDFAVKNIARIMDLFFHFELVTPTFDVLLPVGISFYTFQALSYTVDVFREDIAAEKNIGKYALFVSFFPQLVAGPIERSKNLLTQIHEKHTFNYTRVKYGLQLMLWGLFQKIVIADRVAIVVNTVYGDYTNYEGFQIAVATVLFAVQIYCDFAGYSNMAIGAAQVMGFKLMDNFNCPYFATSIKDFWRRWHISLSSWFKDYLYIPLGGNRCSRFRNYVNLMITFLVSGLWHGASWNFIIWGGLHGTYQIIAHLFKPIKSKAYKLLKVKINSFSFRFGQSIVTFILVDFAWIFFRSPSALSSIEIIRRMFSSFNPWIFFDGSLFTLGLDGGEFAIMIASLCILLVVGLLKQQIHLREVLSEQQLWFRWVVYFACIFIILLWGGYGEGYEQSNFIYFQF